MAKKKPTVKEAKLFKESIQELGFKSIGEFIQVTTAVMQMVATKKYTEATAFAESFIPRLGKILVDLNMIEELQKQNDLLKEKK